MYAARVGAAAMQAVPADTEEITEIRWLTFSGLTAMIAAGEITDGFTLSAVSAWNARQVPLAGAS
jgi:hypothetical protein